MMMIIINLLLLPLLQTSAQSEIKGYVDGWAPTSNGRNLLGWACHYGINQPVTVHVYAGGLFGQGGQYLNLKITLANSNSEAQVSNECGTSGTPHRFVIPFTFAEIDALNWQKLFVYGISLVGVLPNKLLVNSGMFPENPPVSSPIGTWTRISGTTDYIQYDEGSNAILPQSYVMAFAAYQSTGYIYGGSRPPDGWNEVNGYLYTVDLEDGSVRRVSGGNFFNNFPQQMPELGVPGSGTPPPKARAALWFSPKEGALYAFGGYSNYKRCAGNDFWKYNISSSQWTWLAGNFSCGIEERKGNYGVKKIFSSSNYPGARQDSAYWENTDQDMLYFHSGGGAYHGSTISSYFPSHTNSYYDGGDDVWAYDLSLKQWAWIAGSSTSNAGPLSVAPGTESQTPGARNGDITFGKSSDFGLWITGRGSSNTHWLWKFDSKTWIWSTISQINIQNRPSWRASGSISSVGANMLLFYGGYDVSDSSLRYQDLWSFYIPNMLWTYIYGPQKPSDSSRWRTVQHGFDIPDIGSSSLTAVLPGIVKFASLVWKRNVYFFGGLTTYTTNLEMRYTICSENEIFNGTACVSCPNGKGPSNETTNALESCELLCPIGSIRSGSECTNCTFGRYSNAYFGACVFCSPGYFSDDPNRNGICRACESGKYNNIEGLSFCDNCSAGKYNPASGSSSCTECIKGTISLEGSNICDLCTKGKYSPFSNSSFCEECSAYSTTQDKGSISVEQCFCTEGYFGKPYRQESCRKCSESPALRCMPNSSLPSVSEGYFRDSADPNQVFECIPFEACTATDSNTLETTCSEGYTGWVCGSCIKLKYYKFGSNCIACPSIASKVLTFIGIAIALIVLIWKLTKVRSFSSISDLKVFLFWIQIIALYPQVSVTWPRELNQFFQFLSFVNLDVEITSPECSFEFGFWSKYYAKLLLPCIFIVIYMCRWIYSSYGFRLRLIVLEHFLERLEFIFVVVVSVFFTVIFSTLISPFNCKLQSDGSFILWNAPVIKCYEDDWSNVHLPIMCFFLLIFVCLYFGIIAKNFWKHRSLFQKNAIDIETLPQTIAFLTRSYGKRVYWWEVVHLFKRIAIIVCGIMILRSKGPEVYVIMVFILLAFLLLDILALPYERKSMMRISLLWNSIAILILMTDGFVFRSVYVPNDIKFMVGILNISMIIFGMLMSLRQVYFSRISKVRKRFFDGKISGFDSETNLINLQFSPDEDVLHAYNGQNLVNSKIKIGIEWKSDNLPETVVRHSYPSAIFSTSAIPLEVEATSAEQHVSTRPSFK